MTNFNKPAMGLVLIGAMVLGGCSGGTQYTSSDTKRTEVAQQPATTDQNTQTQTDQNNTTADNTAENAQKATGELTIVSFDETAKPGQEVTLTAKAEPGVKLKIEANGAGFDPGLGDQTANEKGEVTWKFNVDNGFKADKMPIIVTALYDQIEKKEVAEIKVDQPKDKLASFSSDLTGLKKSAEPGEKLTIKVQTAPKADVKIEAQGIEGMGPGGKKADAKGIAEFNITVDKNFKADKLPIIITTELDGKEKKTVETIEVPKVAMKNDGKNL